LILKLLKMENPTAEILQAIDGMGDATTTKIKTLERKFDDRILAIEQKAGTSFFRQQNFGPASLKEEINQALVTNDAELKSFLNGDRKHLKIETKTVGDMLISTHLTGGTTSINSPTIGPVGMSYRLNNVRDLLRQTTMTGMYLPLLKDAATGEGVPAPVAEGATKPQIDFDLAETTAKAEVIAGTTTVSKQFFEDLPNARTWLNDRLVELYNAAEADQLLNGDGTSPNLKGLNTAGNFTAASGAATIHIEQLVQGLLQMRILKRRPSGIIINPASLETLILNKATGGSEEYDLPSVVSMSNVGQLLVMGVPVVDVAEQPSGIFTIHDNSGSLYAVRQGITIEMFDQTYATTNKILIRIEARIAFPNFGATYTVKGTFSV
jgi:HK97 family phage major capsid protein